MSLKLISIETDDQLMEKLHLSLSLFVEELFVAIENEKITSKLQLGVYIGKSFIRLIDFLVENAFDKNADELIVAALGLFSSYADSKGCSVKKMNSDKIPSKKPSEKSFVVPGNNLEN